MATVITNEYNHLYYPNEHLFCADATHPPYAYGSDANKILDRLSEEEFDAIFRLVSRAYCSGLATGRKKYTDFIKKLLELE
jgi:hypothetical protein